MEQKYSDTSPPAKDYGSLLGKDVLSYLPVKVLPAVTGLISIIILTRKLAPSEYGTYSVVMTITLLLSQLAGTWLSNAVLYVYPDYVANQKIAFQMQVLKIQALAAVPAALIAYVAILAITHVQSLALIGPLMLVLLMFQFLMQTFLQSTREVLSQAVSVGAQSATQLVILCSLVFLAHGKETAALIAVASGYAAAITILLIQSKAFRSNMPLNHEIDAGSLFKQLFGYGMPMCIWFFATQFYTVGDRLLLKAFNVTESLGQYASFRDLATGCAGFITMPLLMASHPIIMKMWKEGRDRTEIESLMSRNMSLLTLIFAPILVLINVSGEKIIAPILGQKYFLDSRVMLMVCSAIYLGCLTMYIQKGLEVAGRTLPMAKLALIVVVFSLAANAIMIRWLGVFGSASVVVLSNVLYIALVRLYTVDTLHPRINYKFILELLVWVVSAKLLCSIPSLIGISNAHIANSISIIFFSLSVLILFYMNNLLKNPMRYL